MSDEFLNFDDIFGGQSAQSAAQQYDRERQEQFLLPAGEYPMTFVTAKMRARQARGAAVGVLEPTLEVEFKAEQVPNRNGIPVGFRYTFRPKSSLDWQRRAHVGLVAKLMLALGLGAQKCSEDTLNTARGKLLSVRVRVNKSKDQNFPDRNEIVDIKPYGQPAAAARKNVITPQFSPTPPPAHQGADAGAKASPEGAPLAGSAVPPWA